MKSLLVQITMPVSPIDRGTQQWWYGEESEIILLKGISIGKMPIDLPVWGMNHTEIIHSLLMTINSQSPFLDEELTIFYIVNQKKMRVWGQVKKGVPQQF